MIVWGVWGLRNLGFWEGLGERGDIGLWGNLGEREEEWTQDWTQDTDKDWVLKWVLVRIAAFCCARQPQIWIPEIL